MRNHPVTIVATAVPRMVGCLFAVVMGVGLAQADDAAGIAFFESRIRPVLVEHCMECHGADSKPVKGGLRLDSRAGILAGGASGPAIDLADPEGSLLV